MKTEAKDRKSSNQRHKQKGQIKAHLTNVTMSNVSSSVVKGKTKMSRRIPMWLWVVIAKSLGIKLHAKDSPGLASVLHLLTIAAGAGIDMCDIA